MQKRLKNTELDVLLYCHFVHIPQPLNRLLIVQAVTSCHPWLCSLLVPHISMLVLHQSNHFRAIKRMLFYYSHKSIFVLFRVSVCSLLPSCILTLSLLRCL